MESTPDWMSQEADNLVAKHGDRMLTLWLVSALAAVVVLYLVIHPLVMNYFRRRATSQVSKIPALQGSGLRRSPSPVQEGYLETACSYCQMTVFVPKVRGCKPFFCPNCSQTNRPPKKNTWAWLKRILRKLLYPSFQDFF